MSKINYEFVGMYGKRTRYQQKDLAQLLLKVDSAKTASSQELHDFFDTLEYSNHDLPSNHLPKVSNQTSRKHNKKKNSYWS